eukprot:3318666-Amphidinium_carterae.1
MSPWLVASCASQEVFWCHNGATCVTPADLPTHTAAGAVSCAKVSLESWAVQCSSILQQSKKHGNDQRTSYCVHLRSSKMERKRCRLDRSNFMPQCLHASRTIYSTSPGMITTNGSWAQKPLANCFESAGAAASHKAT